jgi:hypothetical protein
VASKTTHLSFGLFGIVLLTTFDTACCSTAGGQPAERLAGAAGRHGEHLGRRAQKAALPVPPLPGQVCTPPRNVCSRCGARVVNVPVPVSKEDMLNLQGGRTVFLVERLLSNRLP